MANHQFDSVKPDAHRSVWLLVPPPPLFVAAFMAGVALSTVVPLTLVPHSLHAVGRALGIALIVAAALLAVVAPALFLRHRTTLIPHGQARVLITGGPYRVTRNPMYLGLAIAYGGATLLVNAVWPLVFLIVPLVVLQARVIPFEEATLVRIFGDEYRRYQQRVGRWLLVLLFAATACNKKDAPSSKESPKPGVEAKQADLTKPCELMARADAEAAVGLALPLTNEGAPKHAWEVASCTYNSTDYFGVELIVRDWEGLGPGREANGSQHPLVPVAGLGDEASCKQGDDTTVLYVKKGDRGLVLTLNSPEIRGLGDRGMGRAKALAAAILPKI